jgi:hypothetical protein
MHSSRDTPFVPLAFHHRSRIAVQHWSELAFACDFAIPFALAELSDRLITTVSLELQTAIQKRSKKQY